MTSDNERAIEALKALEDASHDASWGDYNIPSIISIIRTALQRDDSVVEEVAISALAGDMVNALCDYKILEGNFGDTAARIIISRLALKYPDGLKISEELNDRKS